MSESLRDDDSNKKIKSKPYHIVYRYLSMETKSQNIYILRKYFIF